MSSLQRQMLLVVVMLVLLAGVLWWSWSRWSDATKRADYAAAQTLRVQQLAEEIVGLRAQPLRGGADPNDAEFTFVIEGALVAAGLDPSLALQSIRPEADRSVPGGFREKRTQVRLEGVTRRQLAVFLYTLSEQQPAAFHVGTLQLISPRESPGGETWTVDPLTIAYYIQDTSTAARE